MAYKFSMGETVFSGSITQISGNAEFADAGTVTASAGISGSAIQCSNLTIEKFDANWTNAGKTVANLGTVSAATSITSTAFVGPIDGIVGGSTPAAGTFTALVANDSLVVNANASIIGDAAGEVQLNVQGHSAQSANIFNVENSAGTDELYVSSKGVTVATKFTGSSVDINGGAIDGTVIGGSSVAAGSFAAIVGTTANLSSDLTLSNNAAKIIITDSQAAAFAIEDGGGQAYLDVNTSTMKMNALRPIVMDGATEVGFGSGADMIRVKNSRLEVLGPSDLYLSGGSEILLAGKTLGDDTAFDMNTDRLYFNKWGGSASTGIRSMKVGSFMTDIAGAGLVSGSGGLSFDASNIASAYSAKSDFAAADVFAIYDSANSAQKKVTLTLLGDKLAGAGLTNTNGTLSVDGLGAPVGLGNVNDTIAEGFTYLNAGLTQDRTWTLPATPSAGDIVRVKSGVMNGNVLLVKPGSGDTIDDLAANVAIRIEADYGAVNLIAISDSAWRLF